MCKKNTSWFSLVSLCGCFFPVFGLQESSTFKTFAGNMDVLKETRPLWCLLENVDPGDSPSEEDSTTNVISKMLAESGYATRHLFHCNG